MRKLLVALTASVSLLFGGLSLASPAQATAASSPFPAAPTSAIKAGPKVAVNPAQKTAPKGMPGKVITGGPTANIFTVCNCYRYAEANDTLTAADGAGATFTVHKPTLVAGDAHSLVEEAMISSNVTIEAGITVDPTVNGDSDPHSFVFAWNGATPLGYNTAGGFVNASGCSPNCIGVNMTPLIGSTKVFAIQHFTTAQCGCVNPGYWVGYGAAWIGWWPDALFTGAYVPFTQAKFFGELYAANTPTQSDVGSGVLALGPTPPATAAKISNYALAGSTDTPTLGAGGVTEPTRWAMTLLTATSMQYGGPGGNENIGACSGVGAQPSFGFGVAPYNGGFGNYCLFGSLSGGVAGTPVYNNDGTVARNVCIPNLGTADGQTTQGTVSTINTTYVKWRWFRDAACAGASLTGDYGQLNLAAGWNNLAHASAMRTSTVVTGH